MEEYMVQSDAHPAAEILEDNAGPAVKHVYDDIKTAFRVPIVNLAFRDLARYPDYLELAWRQLHPNVQTVYVEEQADAIRARAVEGVAQLGSAPPLEDESARTTLAVFHYVNPKVLLGVAALRAAAGGQYPKLEELPADAKRQIPTGVPDGVPPVEMVDPAAEGPTRALLSEIRDATNMLLVNSDYRALAQWPSYLELAWRAIEAIRQQAAYRSLERELRLMTESAILVLPFRIDVNPHVMRLCGLDELQIDDVRSTLERYYRELPSLIANIAFLTVGALGRDRARESPFPVTLSR
jgi:hypothetical protein